jgi:hypothetical protein
MYAPPVAAALRDAREKGVRATPIFAKLRVVERREPRLAEASREHDDSSTVTACANLAQTGKSPRSALVWRRRGGQRLGLDFAYGRRQW